MSKFIMFGYDRSTPMNQNFIMPGTYADLEECVKMVETFDTNHALYQKHIVMTKVRDKTIIEGLAKVGGVLDDSIGKNTFVLVVKSKDDVSNKTKYATEHNIPIMTPEEFIKKYLQ